jgi:hypothetical protein
MSCLRIINFTKKFNERARYIFQAYFYETIINNFISTFLDCINILNKYNSILISFNILKKDLNTFYPNIFLQMKNLSNIKSLPIKIKIKILLFNFSPLIYYFFQKITNVINEKYLLFRKGKKKNND